MMLVLLVGILIEFLFHFPKLWKIRQLGSGISLVTIGLWLGAAVFSSINFSSFLLVTISIFRVINLLKLSRDNIQINYLQKVTKRTSFVLGAASMVVLLLIYLDVSVANDLILAAIGFIQFSVAVLILAVTAKNLQKTSHHPTKHYYSDKELPTVTVAIPARNETDDLASCLRTVLANDYPKLEVLVLDDCSQDRTAEIIKDFAHAGVRFIAGEPPADRWLAKNQAYEKLASHASGEVILFCGVDVRFGPQAIRSLVSTMLSKKRNMMSVLPFRIGGGVDTSLIQPLRYWWELALPRRMFNRPPVLSTCWLIKSKTLRDLGYFKGVSHKILPERFFARETIKDDAYAFVRADEHLDLKTVKPIEGQLQTAIRVKYPSLRKRPENVLLLLLVEVLFLLGPIIFSLSWLWTGANIGNIMALLALICLVSVHYQIMSASHPYHSVLALFNYPFAIITEIALTIISMYRYEFGKVEWKGRNICIPTMHVVKSLPKI